MSKYALKRKAFVAGHYRKIKAEKRWPTSYEEFKKRLLDNVLRERKLRSLTEGVNVKKIDALMVVEALCKSGEMAVEFVNLNRGKPQVYLKNYLTDEYDPIEVVLGPLVNIICKKYYISNLSKFEREVHYGLTQVSPNDHPYQPINFPPRTLLKFKNGILDVTTKELLPTTHKRVRDYHFLNTIPIVYEPLKQCDPLATKLVHRFYNDWSNNDPQTKNYYFQINLAVMQGDGRRKCHIFESEGGNGKSSFFLINKILAGSGNTVDANINEIYNNNILNQLNKKVKLVNGDDLASEARISSDGIAVLKSIIDGQPKQAEKKYEHNVIAQTNAVFLQATNSLPKIYENSSAVEDRFFYHRWNSATNYRRNPTTDVNLDKLIGKYDGKWDEKFMQALVAVVIDEVEDFDQFNVPEISKFNMKEALNENDSTYAFWQELQDKGVTKGSETIVASVLFDYYTNRFVKKHYPNTKPINLKTFVRRFHKNAEAFGFELSDNKVYLNSLPIEKYNQKFIEKQLDWSIEPLDNSLKVVLSNKNNIIKESDKQQLVQDVKSGKISPHDILNNPKLLNLALILIEQYDNTLLQIADKIL